VVGRADGDHGRVNSLGDGGEGTAGQAADPTAEPVAGDDPGRLAATIDEWRRRWSDRAVDEERERVDPWALPLVVRVERAAPPTHEAALHAAARSVATILTRPESGSDGPWHPAVARWSEGWIRKVVRRARASRWQEIAGLPGVTASTAGAEVRALLPYPVNAPPAELARLQIAGLDLPKAPAPNDPSSDKTADETAGTTAVLTIATAPDLSLTTGKACAQVGHAAQLALLQLDRETVLAWATGGHPVRVVRSRAADWKELLRADARVALVRDGGLTEVPPGTRTCAATFDRIG
jgi:peptidyl-tRNA hydrolase